MPQKLTAQKLLIGAAALLALVALVLFWNTGGFDRVAFWAAEWQRDFQNQMARTLRSLRAGTPGALWALLGACFAYGFFHAAGPGHGKVLIGGYGLGRQVSWVRLSLISLAASLGQAVSAIALVYGGVWILSLGRAAVTDTADHIMAPVSYAAIALIGLWLVWRGIRHARTLSHDLSSHDLSSHGTSGHGASNHGAVCSTCGHAHGPTPEQIAGAHSLREAAILVAGIAIRPCTGALFVLLITWQMGIVWAGIAGVLAMALGTAIITTSTGLAAVSLRGGLLAGLATHPMLQRAIPLIEVTAGASIALIAGGLLWRSVGW